MPLGFGLPSPLHDSMRDISLQARRLYALVDFRLYRAERLFILRAGKTWAGLQRVPSIATSSVKPAAWYRPVRPPTPKPLVICGVSAGWTAGLLDLLLSLDWNLFGLD